KGSPHWTWALTVILFLIIAWLSTVPTRPTPAPEAALQGDALRFATATGFDEVTDIVLGHCSMCHAAEPVWQGLHWPPKGVVLETPEQIAHNARRIYLQSGLSHAMPPAGRVPMDDEARAAIVAWFRAANG
ncbi:MAG: urate hydroxylase PuuD, partial [Paracoccaceae bacterium]